VDNAGVYQITFGVTQNSTTAVSTFALFLNGANQGTNYTVSTQSYVGGAVLRGGLTSITTTITLAANDDITIVNTSGGTRSLTPPGGGPRAFVNIIQIQ
jgi:hypothetical protein